MATAAAQSLRAQREAVVNAHIEAEAVRHDVAATLATFRTPRYDVPAMGGLVDGEGAVTALLTQLLSAFPDFWLEKTAVHHSDDAVIVECNFGGTHRGTWAGIEATGRPMSLQAALFYLFDGSDLICERVYFDHATMLRQLGT
jgi:steroid delta-isomerase-like uncharacterized protein